MTSYHGGKQKIGETIASVIDECVKNIEIKGYCEPFCGMLGVYRHIPYKLNKKITYKAGDYNESLIMMWKKAQKGWMPPEKCSERHYNELKNQIRPSAEKGFIGHQYSFGGQYFKGYRGIYGNKSEYKKAAENVHDIATELYDVHFSTGDYLQFGNLKNYVIYCDPPYSDNKKSYYFDEEHNRLTFDHIAFWNWCLDMSHHNIIFVSEYTCPIKDARIKKVYEKIVKLTGANPKQRKRKERLYMICK